MASQWELWTVTGTCAAGVWLQNGAREVLVTWAELQKLLSGAFD